MNASQLFKAAHALTRKAIRQGDSYQVTFAAALRIVYQESKSMSRTLVTITNGSPKQIAWAESIRTSLIEAGESEIARLRAEFDDSAELSDRIALIESGMNAIARANNAKWFIDHTRHTRPLECVILCAYRAARAARSA